MNRVFIDKLCEGENACHLIFEGDMQPMKNMVFTKFPAPDRRSYMVHPSQSAMVVWFDGSGYEGGGGGLLDDLQLLGYEVVVVDRNFQRFEVMVEHIEKVYGVSTARYKSKTH